MDGEKQTSRLAGTCEKSPIVLHHSTEKRSRSGPLDKDGYRTIHQQQCHQNIELHAVLMQHLLENGTEKGPEDGCQKTEKGEEQREKQIACR